MQIPKRIGYLFGLLFITILLVTLSGVWSGEKMSHADHLNRSFYQGFIYQPYDWNEAAFEDTFKVMGENSDLIGFYFDSFVPWNESAERKPYHLVQEQEIQKRLNGIRPHQKVFLGTSILGSDRVSLSGYLGKDEVPRTGKWKNKTFDEPEVIEAYLNWCRDLISRFKPNYFMYVAEVDAGFFDVEDPRFQSLLRAVKQIYPTLKQEYPRLPILLEFMLENDEEMNKRAEVTQLLLPYTDIYAVSTFPFLMTGGNPADIPVNWFSRVRKIAPNKPFAVVETNFLAENFYHPTQGIPIPFNNPHPSAPQMKHIRNRVQTIMKWRSKTRISSREGKGGKIRVKVMGSTRAIFMKDCFMRMSNGISN